MKPNLSRLNIFQNIRELDQKNRFYLIGGSLILLVIFFLGIQKTSAKSDFQDYYKASTLFRNHQDIYQLDILKPLKESIKTEDVFKLENLLKLESIKNSVGTYIYPPTFAFLLLAISWLSYSSASVIFYLMNFLALLFSMYLIFQRLQLNKKFFVFFFAILFSFRFLENHSYNNQVAFFLLFLILCSFSTKNDLLSGVLLSLAIVIKLTPAIFFLYLLFKRDFKRIFYTIFFLIVWVFLPFVSGIDYNWGLLKSWIEMVLGNFMQNPEFRAWKNNQSLVATLAKYFLINGDPANQAEFGLPFVILTQKTVKGLFYLSSMIVLGVGAFRFWKRKGRLEDNLVISVLFILSVVFSGISWIHSFVFLLFPIAYGFLEIFEGNHPRYIKYLFWVSVCIPVVSGRVFVGVYLENFLLMFSVLLYSSIFLYVTILFLGKHEN